MGDSENGPIMFHTFYRFVWDERAQEGSPDLSPCHESMRRRFVTLLQKLCIQGIIDPFWLAFKGVNRMVQIKD